MECRVASYRAVESNYQLKVAGKLFLALHRVQSANQDTWNDLNQSKHARAGYQLVHQVMIKILCHHLYRFNSINVLKKKIVLTQSILIKKKIP